MSTDTQKVDVLSLLDEVIHDRQFSETVNELITARAAVAELIEVMRDILPYVVSDTLEHCGGNKCRESWCIGCCGEEYATESVAKANACSHKAYGLLQRIGATP